MPRPTPSLIETARFWWLDHGGTVGLVLGALVILLLGALLVPRGTVTLHTGRVTGFRALSSETGTDVYAAVDVEGRPTLVRLPANNGCSVDSAIALRKARFPLGERYAIQGRACALTD